MPMRWAPLIVYNAGVNLQLSYPMLPIQPSNKKEAGGSKSGAGIPETYIIRNDYMAIVTLRLTEAEWQALVTFINWCHDSGSLGFFTFIPDPATTMTGVTCWLEEPKVDADVRPTRDDRYRGVFTLPLTLRSTLGTNFDWRMFG